MKRRSFVLATGATTLGIALVVQRALGQAGKEPRRIGVLSLVGTPSASAKGLLALRDGLRSGGHVEGHDVLIEGRYAARQDEFPRLAAELAALKPAVIVAYGRLPRTPRSLPTRKCPSWQCQATSSKRASRRVSGVRAAE